MTKIEIEYKIEQLKLLLKKPEKLRPHGSIDQMHIKLELEKWEWLHRTYEIRQANRITSEKLRLRWLNYTPDYDNGICSLDYYVVLEDQLDKFLDLYGANTSEVLLAVLNKIRSNIYEGTDSDDHVVELHLLAKDVLDDSTYQGLRSLISTYHSYLIALSREKSIR